MAWYNKWALMVIAAAIYTAAYNFAISPGFATPDWGTWIGSIGTILTFLGTIWLATTETRNRERASNKLAAVTAAQLLFQVVEVSKIIEGATEAFKDLESDPRELCGKVAGMLSKPRIWNTQDLANITVIPNNVAPKLAICGADIDWCARSLTQVSALQLERPPEQFWEMINIASNRLNSCRETLQASQEALTIFLVKENFDGW